MTCSSTSISAEFDPEQYEFSKWWFWKKIPHWRKWLQPLLARAAEGKQAIRVLEVGSFEGFSACWLLINLARPHADSRVVCVDTWQGGVEHTAKEYAPTYAGILDGLEARFRRNVDKTGCGDKLRAIKGESRRVLVELLHECDCKRESTFDLIYIDGSHLAYDVLADAVLAFALLKTDGLIIFDDYFFAGFKEEFNNPRLAIDAFLAAYAPFIEFVAKSGTGGQVIVRKTAYHGTQTLVVESCDDAAKRFKK